MNRKFLTRAIALALVIILSLSLLPLASMAATIGKVPNDSIPADKYPGFYIILDEVNPDFQDVYFDSDEFVGGGVKNIGTIGNKVTFTPDQYVKYNGKIYDLETVVNVPDYVVKYLGNPDDATDAEIKHAIYWLDVTYEQHKDSLNIPRIPTDPDEFKDWVRKYGGMIMAIYGAHQHVYSCWIPDNNNHWAKCLVCGENFLLMNWHYDNDEDDWCDVCGHEIIYYDISIKDVEGAKITIDGDRDMTAPYRDWIEVSVEAEEGYKVTDVRVWKIRENGTKDQITRKIVKRGSEYKFEMQNFDCEIVATVVKK